MNSIISAIFGLSFLSCVFDKEVETGLVVEDVVEEGAKRERIEFIVASPLPPTPAKVGGLSEEVWRRPGGVQGGRSGRPGALQGGGRGRSGGEGQGRSGGGQGGGRAVARRRPGRPPGRTPGRSPRRTPERSLEVVKV